MKEVDKKIKAYYKSKSLTKDQLNKIVGTKTKDHNSPWSSILKYAAVFCFILTSFLIYQYYGSNKQILLEKYGKEVAFNHLKNLESDILTPNLKDLNTKMDKLNFKIDIPTELDTAKYALLGGRYCSIDERLAAQLKLQCKKTDAIVTLYVLDKAKGENFDDSFDVSSTAIRIWNSPDNLFVLASDISK